MTAFIVVCAAMLAAALVWITLPLWRPKAEVDAVSTRSERRTSSIVVVLALSGLAFALYATFSNWDWQGVEAQSAENASVEEMLKRLEAKLHENPKDVDGWLLLGRSYTAMGRFPRAADAFQQAYDLTKGENVEAMVGLGEALTLTDEASLGGRAGQLFESALAKAPNHPKALWYGSMASLQEGDLRAGRDRLRLLMTLNPPEQLRNVLERQIQDLDQQLGESRQSGEAPAGPFASQSQPQAAEGAPQAGQRLIRVSVSIAPDIQQKLGAPMTMFVLARDAGAGGPPLAVKRLSSAAAPLTVELSERDAMIPTHTIASVPRVQVVARLSRSGTPTAQSGDFYGQADYEFAKDPGTLQIVIDRAVP